MIDKIKVISNHVRPKIASPVIISWISKRSPARTTVPVITSVTSPTIKIISLNSDTPPFYYKNIDGSIIGA
jgi:hypothetical protein